MSFKLHATTYIQDNRFLIPEYKFILCNIYELLRGNQIKSNPTFTVSDATFTLFKSPDIDTPIIGPTVLTPAPITDSQQLGYKLDSGAVVEGPGLYIAAFYFKVTSGPIEEWFRIEVFCRLDQLDTGVTPPPEGYQYTDAQARNAVGGILENSPEIILEYLYNVPSIKAYLQDLGVLNEHLAAGINATKIADGSVTNAAYQRIANLVSDAQTQIDSKQTSLGYTAENLANKNQANGYAGLDGSGLISPSQLPAIAITVPFVVNSQAAQLALTAQVGDVAIRTDESKTYIHNGGTSGTMSDWNWMLTPTDLVLSVFGRTGIVTPQTNDYTWAQIDKSVSNIQDIVAGTLAVARGGTNSNTALNNNRLMISSGGKIVETAALSPRKLLMADLNGLPIPYDIAGDLWMFEDWISNTTAGAMGWTNVSNGTGSADVMSTYGLDATYQAIGVMRLSTGTTAAGRSTQHLAIDNIRFGIGVAYSQSWIVAIDDSSLSNGTDPYVDRIGFGDVTGAGDFIDGAYFEYDHNQSANWRYCT